MERIKVSIGHTFNMGHYESLRLDVGVELDGDPHNSGLFEEAQRIVQEQLSKLTKAYGVTK